MAERNKKKYLVQFLCYSPRIYSGFDRFNLKLASNLKEKGYQSVFVFTNNIDVQELIDDLYNEGVIIELISTKNKIILAKDILKVFFKYKPAIVHAHFVNFIQLVCSIFSIFFLSRFYITFHSTISLYSRKEYQNKKGWIKLFLLTIYYKYLICVSKKVFCVSNAIRKQFCQFANSTTPKIETLYLGVKLNEKHALKEFVRQQFSLPLNDVLLCNVSAIEPIKGIDTLIESIKIIKEQNKMSNVKCYHIGGLRIDSEENRQYRDLLYEKVKASDLENEFIWLGHRNDINEILQAFDMYIHPSRMEGLGVTLMEAAANSLPLAGTNVGGIPEIIHHGKNGFLFSVESVEELTATILKFVENEELRVNMGKESFKLVYTTFNADRQTEILTSKYCE